jgi:hypothetical protein
MRLPPLLIAVLLASASSSSAGKIVDSQFSITADVGRGFRLLAWVTLAPEFPKEKRVVVAELNCSDGSTGGLRFRALNVQKLPPGNEQDQVAVAAAIYTGNRLKIGPVTASCLSGKLKLNTASAAALRSIFADHPRSPEQLAAARAIGVSEDVTFSANAVWLARVPFVFRSGVLSTPERASGLAMGVTQGRVLKPLANGMTSTPMPFKAGQPYTLHVITSDLWLNLTINGGQLIAWMQRKP